MTTTKAQCRDERRDGRGLRQPVRPQAPAHSNGNGDGRPAEQSGNGRLPSQEGPFASAELRRVFGAFPTGVTAIAALVDGAPAGLAANSFTSVSLDPPLLSVCVAHTSTTWPVLADRARLGVTVLGAEQEAACAQLAARTGDRFAGLDWHATDDGAVLLDGGSAWFDCSIEQHVRAGDHDIVLLRIHALDADHSVPPLVFHASRFRRLEEAADATVRTPASDTRVPAKESS
jgi:flavin reductase (DIM6/NTAB) family NADH-FMN oxidoreductase RutF